MQKIASPQELQAELQGILAFIHEHGPDGKPDRQVIAGKLRALADRVAASEALPKLPGWLTRKLRGKDVKVERGQLKVVVGPREGEANRLESSINAEANRNKSSDKNFDIEAWGGLDPKTGDYAVYISY